MKYQALLQICLSTIVLIAAFSCTKTDTNVRGELEFSVVGKIHNHYLNIILERAIQLGRPLTIEEVKALNLTRPTTDYNINPKVTESQMAWFFSLLRRGDSLQKIQAAIAALEEPTKDLFSKIQLLLDRNLNNQAFEKELKSLQLQVSKSNLSKDEVEFERNIISIVYYSNFYWSQLMPKQDLGVITELYPYPSPVLADAAGYATGYQSIMRTEESFCATDQNCHNGYKAWATCNGVSNSANFSAYSSSSFIPVSRAACYQ